MFTFNRAKRTLLTERKVRLANVAAYDLNIDRYRRMLVKIGPAHGSANMKAYAEELRQRLDAESAQRAREQLTLDALNEQIEEAR